MQSRIRHQERSRLRTTNPWISTGIVALHVIALGSLLVQAEPLPKGAIPLNPSEVRAIYQGTTARYGPDCTGGDYGRASFLSNGVFRGLVDSNDPNERAIFSGKWSIKGNRLCFPVTGTFLKSRKRYKETRCFDHFRVGSVVYANNAVSESSLGQKCKQMGKRHYWKVKSMRRGDLTAPDFERVKKKLGQ